MVRLLAVSLLFVTGNVLAQFTPALLQNDSYWDGGKAEFNIYGAEIARYGIPRSCEVLHVLVREPFDPKQLVKPDNPKPDAIPVLKMNQILHVPTGLYVYQQMHSNFWRVDNAQLLKFSLTSNDSCGNTFKQARREGDRFAYEYHTYWDGMADGKENLTVPANGYFYDELPWLVRTIDFFSKPAGAFEVQLASTTVNSKKDAFEFKPAKISYKSTERTIEVAVEHAGGNDRFILDERFPHLLREWNAADGSKLKMKRSLKVAYWNFNKPGDRERALADPMLRHPD